MRLFWAAILLSASSRALAFSVSICKGKGSLSKSYLHEVFSAPQQCKTLLPSLPFRSAGGPGLGWQSVNEIYLLAASWYMPRDTKEMLYRKQYITYTLSAKTQIKHATEEWTKHSIDRLNAYAAAEAR